MIDRKIVYRAIDGEREYQEGRAVEAGTIPGNVRPHSVEEFVLYMDDYMTELKHQLSRIWTSDRSAPPEALDTLRKVTALGVACMEQNGVKFR